MMHKFDKRSGFLKLMVPISVNTITGLEAHSLGSIIGYDSTHAD